MRDLLSIACWANNLIVFVIKERREDFPGSIFGVGLDKGIVEARWVQQVLNVQGCTGQDDSSLGLDTLQHSACVSNEHCTFKQMHVPNSLGLTSKDTLGFPSSIVNSRSA